MYEFGSPFFWLVMFLIMAGSFVYASAGFGFAIMLVGALQFFMPPVELVGIIIILGSVGATLRVIETRKIGKWKQSLRFIVPALFSVPLGVALLKYLDPLLMKRYLNLALLAGAIMLAYSMTGHGTSRFKGTQDGSPIEPLVGFISGFLGGFCTLSGPPIVIWGVLRGWKKIEMHALWARFFFSVAVFSLVNLGLQEMYKRRTITLSLLMIPAVFAGFKIGTWVRDRITEKRFRHYVLAFLFLSGLTGLAMSFR